MNTLIIYAHTGEVKYLRDKLGSHKPTLGGITLASFRDKSKKASLDKLLDNADLIINAGIAGRLSDSLSLGESYLIENLTNEKRSTLFDLTGERFFKIAKETINSDGSHSATLVTCGQPITDTDSRISLTETSGADLVDMEALPIYNKAVKSKTPFLCIKLVSDNADEEAETTVKKRTEILSKKLGSDMLKLLVGLNDYNL